MPDGPWFHPCFLYSVESVTVRRAFEMFEAYEALARKCGCFSNVVSTHLDTVDFVGVASDLRSDLDKIDIWRFI